MDAIGANNDIGFRRRAVGERYPRDIAALFIADAAMAGMNDADRQRWIGAGNLGDDIVGLRVIVEEARIDPDNVEVLVQHLKCAAFELPFKRGDAFGSLAPEDTSDALDFLASHRVLHEGNGAYHWAADAYPANEVSLRSVGWDNVVIIDLDRDKVLAVVGPCFSGPWIG